jgi:hypothetical protein
LCTFYHCHVLLLESHLAYKLASLRIFVLLGGIFMIWDTVGIYRDVTAKSIADYLREIAEKAEATLEEQEIKNPEE